MQFYGKAEQAAKRILELFQEPDRLPKALAPIFIHRDDNKPCRAWSWSNQLLTALAATDDARGFRQWEKVGRHVTKGSHAFHILGPVSVKRADTDDTGKKTDRYVTVGFKSIPVFRYEDTEGDALPDEPTEFMDALPLVSA